MSSLTGYEYRPHFGCKHPVRTHGAEGCKAYKCDCGTTRAHLATPAAPFWSALHWLCTAVGAVFLLWHGGGFLINAILGWLA